MKAEIRRNGKVFVQEYSCGKPFYPVKTIGESIRNRNHYYFKPDDSIFLTTTYKYEVLAARLRELAFLNSGIRLTD
jgi:DNA gyrase subunit B